MCRGEEQIRVIRWMLGVALWGVDDSIQSLVEAGVEGTRRALRRAVEGLVEGKTEGGRVVADGDVRAALTTEALGLRRMGENE